ncbi:O-methyltransferase ZRP4 [Zea mays]|uniref:O-methyltransferase ZRP4 n=1 Tax=Zea mays TaxID=4577 RepID=A0A1D6EH08_MAIZE|nr:O-methyltransferase ZRP4 [Zea mays]
MASEVVRPSDAELLQAQADIWRLSLSYLTPLSLKCAVVLGIPRAIYRHGGAASAAELITALSLPSAKLPFLRRLLRLLAASGVFTVDRQSTEEERYRISPVSYLLVEGIPHEDHMNHTSFVLTCTSSRYIEPAIGLAEWFRKDTATSPFEELHGATLFHESMGSLDADFHDMASDALDTHDNFGVEMALREFRDLFEGIQSMTYCCGNFGDDKGARAIAKAFPHIKCTVLAPPKIIAAKPADGVKINYVEGDMFSFIPPAQTVVLKLLMDIGMMTMTKGRQHDEKEWRQLFTKAGFSEYKILKEFGTRVAFEVYP